MVNLPSARQPRAKLALRIAAFVVTVANVVFNFVHDSLGLPGSDMVTITDRHSTLFRPAGYAFSIWGVIFAVSIAYTVVALLPSQRGVRLHDRVAPWLVVSGVLQSAFVLVYRQDLQGFGFLVVLANWAVALVLFLLADAEVTRDGLAPIYRTPFALLLGWISVATLASGSLALAALGYRGQPLSEELFTLGLLLVASLMPWVTSVVYKDAVVPFVVSWAGFAIAIQSFQDSTLVGSAAFLLGLVMLLLGLATYAFRFREEGETHRKSHAH